MDNLFPGFIGAGAEILLWSGRRNCALCKNGAQVLGSFPRIHYTVPFLMIYGAITEHVEKDLEICFINPGITQGGVCVWI
jgi:hypothetical protein